MPPSKYAPGDNPEIRVLTFSEVCAEIRASLRRAGLPHDAARVRAEASRHFARILAPKK